MREQLKVILDKAAENLNDARYLYEGQRYEASVNRAYYAMLTAVQGLLLDKDLYVKTHSGAKAKFSEIFLKMNLLPLELGKIYENAFNLRLEADYEFAMHIPSEAALQTIVDAAKFIKAVNVFLESR